MASETETFAVGNAVYPLTSANDRSLLQDADPAVYWVLQYLATVLKTHIESRLLVEVAAIGGTDIAEAVAYQMPDDPSDYLSAEHVHFPLLSVYRSSEAMADRTTTWRNVTAEWKCCYVLPPLMASQRERLRPILTAVRSIISDRIEMGHDASFESGAAVFGSAYANLESIYVKSAIFSSWDNGGELTFPTVMLTLEVKERTMPVVGAFDALAGADTSVDTSSSSEATLADVVVIDQDLT